MISIIEKDNMEKVNASDYAVVDFFATWCGPCKMLAPVMEELSEELAGEVDFFKADVDANPELAAKYQIMSIPSVFVFKKGELVDKMVGFGPKATMKEFILRSK